MELMAEGWTGQRLDDLKDQVERLERRTEDGFRELRGEIGALREDVDRRLDRMDGRLDRMDGRLDRMDGRLEHLGERIEIRFDAMQHALLVFGGATLAGTASIVAALIVVRL